ncbi:hypothetical protein GQ55_6G221200 [Panicum hallii var. hallii]|uniref:Uncharacterized protein n=1 Tax=Panicum hallii var. hallii TaxID=1504633 RepID=A0A2T7D8F4_9POAL|nr:hypothetical protein GQ55_6G221200 [Panicum hallii var. hallii]
MINVEAYKIIKRTHDGFISWGNDHEYSLVKSGYSEQVQLNSCRRPNQSRNRLLVTWTGLSTRSQSN